MSKEEKRFVKQLVPESGCPIVGLRISAKGINAFGWGESKDPAFVREEIAKCKERAEEELLRIEWLELAIETYKANFTE